MNTLAFLYLILLSEKTLCSELDPVKDEAVFQGIFVDIMSSYEFYELCLFCHRKM